jgi:hypothetical protein
MGWESSARFLPISAFADDYGSNTSPPLLVDPDDGGELSDVMGAHKNDEDVSVVPVREKDAKAMSELWHARMGHVGDRTMFESLRSAHMSLPYPRLTLYGVSTSCESCKLGMAKRVGHPKVSDSLSTIPGAVWHMDTFGPTRSASMGGSRYSGVSYDEGSMCAFTAFARQKSQIPQQLLTHLIRVNTQMPHTVKAVHTDNAPEYVVVWKYCEENGISVYKTVAGESAQNGCAERAIGIFTGRARTMMLAAGATQGFWAEAFAYSRHIHNHTAHACFSFVW